MTGDKSKFTSFKYKEQGHITYGDNNKGKILGIGKVGKTPSTSIDNVLYVEGLKHSLLSISQLCDKGNEVVFNSKSCSIKGEKDNVTKFQGQRVNNVYMIDLDNISSNDAHCLISKEDDSWLWHRRIAHIHMNHLNKLISKQLVVGLPSIKFKMEGLCDACQKGKQVKASFMSKNVVSTSRPLQLLHLDLFGPSRTMGFGVTIMH